ncbi:MAG: Ig domain-containing protein, partial [Spartobacteria bacterium]
MNFFPISGSFRRPRRLAWALAAILCFLASPLLAQVPVVTSSLKANGKVGEAFTYQIKATNKPTKFSATGLPAGLKLNGKTGLISGTPIKSGTFRINVSALNAKGSSKTAFLEIKVSPVRPAITSALSANGTVGTAFSYQISASNNPATYGAAGLPSGLSVALP